MDGILFCVGKCNFRAKKSNLKMYFFILSFSFGIASVIGLVLWFVCALVLSYWCTSKMMKQTLFSVSASMFYRNISLIRRRLEHVVACFEIIDINVQVCEITKSYYFNSNSIHVLIVSQKKKSKLNKYTHHT